MDDVTEQCHVLPIVQVQSLWFVQKQFGCTLVADKLLVWPSSRGQAASRDFDFILPEKVDKKRDRDEGVDDDGLTKSKRAKDEPPPPAEGLEGSLES